jgi:tetratricopeptide (TPR) repeat protein
MRKGHERLAARVEQGASTAFAELTVHYDQCGNHAKAYECALAAVESALSVHKYHTALDLLAVAERNALSGAQLADVQVRSAQIHELLAQYAEAAEQCEQALAYTIDQGDRRRALPLRRMRERLRGFLGEPFRRTLGACLILADEARELGETAEYTWLLTMISLAHNRLGEREAAERVASEAVQSAEHLGHEELRGETLARLAVTIMDDRPAQSARLLGEAVELAHRAGARRSEARYLNSLGVAQQRLNDWPAAEKALSSALEVGRAAELAEVVGAVALNLGVGYLKRGEYRPAQELFAEALAVFSAAKHRQFELIVVYNIAHLDLAQREYASAAELYDLAAQLAEQIGQSDVQLGALSGVGLARLALREVDAARAAHRRVEERIQTRSDWFQGRELVEALRIRVAALDGRTADAARELERALAAADGADFYGAAWLAAACAGHVFGADATPIEATVGRYAEKVRGMGYSDLSSQYAALVAKR